MWRREHTPRSTETEAAALRAPLDLTLRASSGCLTLSAAFVTDWYQQAVLSSESRSGSSPGRGGSRGPLRGQPGLWPAAEAGQALSHLRADRTRTERRWAPRSCVRSRTTESQERDNARTPAAGGVLGTSLGVTSTLQGANVSGEAGEGHGNAARSLQLLPKSELNPDL